MLIQVGLRIGMITGAGSKWETLGENYKGKVKIQERLLLDPDFKTMYRESMLKILTV